MELPDEAQLSRAAERVGARSVGRRDSDAEFELVVRSLIDGLYTRLNASVRWSSVRFGPDPERTE